MAKSNHYFNSFTVTLGPNGNGQGTPIDFPRDGSDVDILRISVTAAEAGVAVDPQALLQFTLQGGGNETLFVVPQHVRNLTGNSSQPWPLPEPIRIAGNSKMAMDLTKLTTTASTVFYVAISGRKVWPKASATK